MKSAGIYRCPSDSADQKVVNGITLYHAKWLRGTQVANCFVVFGWQPPMGPQNVVAGMWPTGQY